MTAPKGAGSAGSYDSAPSYYLSPEAQAVYDENRRSAAHYVASEALDVDDARELLDMLGCLDADLWEGHR